MRNGWTGGQYSLVRGLIGGAFGLYLLRAAILGTVPAAAPAHSAGLRLLTWVDGVPEARVAAFVGAALALCLAAGFHDRLAAIGAGYAVLLFATAEGPWGGAALVLLVALHLALPSAPYGSWAARGRVDPAGGWRYPRWLFLAAWILLAAGYAAVAADRVLEPHWLDGSALTGMLEGPDARSGPLADLLLRLPSPVRRGATWIVLSTHLAALPLLWARRSRPWSWLLLGATQWTCLLLFRADGLPALLAVLHLYTFDPGWIPAAAEFEGSGDPAPVDAAAHGRPAPASAPETVFYDGTCALCQGSVRFVLAEERGGDTFRFAPLGGRALRESVSEQRRRALPDSIVVQRTDGSLLTRSGAVLYALRRLGGLWRPLGRAGLLVPRPIRDRVYEGVAAVRYRIFGRSPEACPILPPALRSRFDLRT